MESARRVWKSEVTSSTDFGFLAAQRGVTYLVSETVESPSIGHALTLSRKAGLLCDECSCPVGIRMPKNTCVFGGIDQHFPTVTSLQQLDCPPIPSVIHI